MSKQPLAKTMRAPFLRAIATRAMTRLRSRMRDAASALCCSSLAFMGLTINETGPALKPCPRRRLFSRPEPSPPSTIVADIVAERGVQLLRGDAGRPALHDDDAPGVVGEVGGLPEGRAGGERERVGRDHRVARARHVHRVERADGADARRPAFALLEEHRARLAARHEQRPEAQFPPQTLAPFGERRVALEPPAEDVLDLVLVRRRRSEAPEVPEAETRVHEDGPRAFLRRRAQVLDRRRARHAVVIVGDDDGLRPRLLLADEADDLI